jgi:hypothetical protein
MTHTKDEVLKLALEALEGMDILFSPLSRDCTQHNAVDRARKTITDIKQALAAPVQEPIYQMQMMDGKWIDQAEQSYEYNKAHGHKVRTVYTTPPAAPVPTSWMEMVTVNLLRVGVNKHVARELAEHFYGLAQPAPVQPVWIQPDHLQKAQKAPFLCRVEPHKRDDFVPLYTTPTAAQPAIPDAITDNSESPEYRTGWNDYRAAMMEMMK